jgi:hypothetical protein
LSGLVHQFDHVSEPLPPDVLIPRPESEGLVERALARLPEGSGARVLDVATGSGAIALAIARERPQADVLGIFGREGLELAARWTTPDASTPTYKAIKIFRNYDGQLSGFGDTSVKTTSSSNPDNLSVFSATRTSDGAMTVMVINKIAGSTPVTLSLANFRSFIISERSAIET